MQHFSALISGPLSCCPPSWRCWTLDCFIGLVKPSEPSSNNASMWSLLEIFKKYFLELWFFKSLEVWNAHLSGKWWDDCITHTMRTVIYLGARRRLKWLRRLDNSGESYWELREQSSTINLQTKPNQTLNIKKTLRINSQSRCFISALFKLSRGDKKKSHRGD